MADKTQTLLDLSSGLASIRARTELFDFIFTTLKRIISFDDAVINIWEERGKKIRILTTDQSAEAPKNFHYKTLTVQPFNTKGTPYEEIWKKEAPFLLDLPKDIKKYSDFPGVKLVEDMGYKEDLVIPLFFQGEKLGVLELLSKKKGFRKEIDEPLIPLLGSQLAIAVSNILANEEILKEREEKEALLKISDDISRVRNIDDLMQVVFNRLQSIFHFDDAVVCTWIDQGNQFRMLSSDKSTDATKQNEYEYFLSGPHPTKDTPYEVIYAKNDLTFFTLDYWKEKFPSFPAIQLIDKVGYVEHLIIPLWQRTTKIGVLEFHCKKEGKLKNHSVELFKGAADQIAAAVSNILANEEILERQQEKETLLNISETVNSIRDKHQLLEVISNKVRPHLNFDYFVISLFNDSLTEHLQWTINLDDKLGEKKEFHQIDQQWYPIHDTPIEYFASQDQPFFFTASEINEKWSDFPGTQLYMKMGMRKSVCTPLTHANKKIGILLFHSSDPDFDKAVNLSFVNNLSQQLSVAVSNILANEEILDRQKEKETLLSISEYLAKVRDWPHLFTTIFEDLKPVFGFNDVVVTIPDSSLEQGRILASNAEERYHGKINYEKVARGTLPTPPHFKEIHKLKSPKLYELGDYEKMSPGFPGVALMKEVGLKATWASPLRSGGKVIGTLEFHYTEKAQAEMLPSHTFRNVADQLSVAVSNILANEDILERQKEKEILLSISESLGRTRNKEEFWKVVANDIRPIMKFSDAVVVTSKGKAHHAHFLVDAPAESQKSENFKPITRLNTNAGSPYPYNLSFDQPAIVDLEEWAKEAPDYPGALLMKEQGLTESFRAPLVYSGVKFGLLWFHYKAGELPKNKLGLFSQIADQVAAAVSNILASEEILQRQEEKEILLSISEAMTTIRSRQDFYQVVIDKIQPLVKFADSVTTVLNRNGKFYKHFLQISEGLSEEFNQVDWQPLASSEVGWYLQQDDIFDTQIGALQQQFPKSVEVKALRQAGIESSRGLKLNYGGELIGILLFHFKGEERVQLKKELYKNISEQIATAVSNILANEEILEGRKEKETLLSISDDITNIRDRNDLFRVMMSKVKEFIRFEDAVVMLWPPERDTHQVFLNIASEKVQKHPNFKDVVNVHFPTPGSAMEKFMATNDLHFWEAEEELKEFSDHPGLQMQVDTGLLHSLNVFLKSGKVPFGMLMLHFTEFPQFLTEKKELLKSISDQVGVAVLNILANEDILNRQEEKEALLGISEEITNIRDRDDLFRVMMSKVKDFIRFDDAVLSLYNQESKTVHQFLTLAPKKRKQHVLYSKIVGQTIPYEGTPFEELLGKDLQLFSLAYWLENYPDFPGTVLMKDTGLNYTFNILLQSGKVTTGSLLFHFSEAPNIDIHRSSFFKGISDQVSVAVQNILANEEILERQEEKETLLSISEVMNTIRDRENLLEVLQKHIQPILGFEQVLALEVDRAEECYRPLVIGTTHEPTLPSDAWLPLKGTKLKRYLKKADPFTVSSSEVNELYPDLNAENGTKILAVKLLHANSLIGIIFFCYKKQPGSVPKTPLHKNVGEQLALAISNVLSNEDILARQQEKENLLRISESMTTIRDREDLFRVMMEQIEPLLGFKDAVATQLNEDQTAFKTFLTISSSDRKKHPKYKEAVNKWIPVAGTEVEYVLGLDDTFRLDTESMIASFPNSPGLQLMRETGLTHTIGIKLFYAGRLIGIVFLHFDHEHPVTPGLFKNLGEQLAIAISNILANEDILERQKEKEILLSISEAMTTIRSRQDFYQVVMEKIQPLVRFADAVTTVLNREGTYYKHFLVVTEAKKNLLSKADWQRIDASEMGWYLSQQDFFEFDIHELVEQFRKNRDVLAIQKKGIKHSKGIKLFYGGELVGVLLFHFKEDKPQELNKELYKNISEQIATAVSNILANEDILERQEEKETLLSITKDITNIRNRNDLFQVMMSKVKDYIQFDDAVVVTWNSDKDQFKAFLNLASEERKAHPAFKEIVNIDLPIVGTPIETFVDSENLMYWNLKDMKKKYPDFPGLTLQSETGLNHSLNLHLKSGDIPFGVLLFHFENPPTFDTSKNELLLGIADQVSVAVLNILANEEILERQKEKETLLSISEDIALVRNKEELWTIISEKLQPIFNFQDAVILRSVGQTHHQHIMVYAAADIKEFHTYAHVVHDIHPNEGTTWNYQMSLGGPHILYLEDLMNMEEGANHPGFLMMKEMGRVESFGAPLNFAGEKFGFLWFHYLKDELTKEKLSLFGQVADQIAAAVSNILANENILERQKEKETLLSISEDIAAIRNRDDLYHVILNKIKPYFPFDDAVVISIDEKAQTYNHILNMADEGRKNHPQFEQVVGVSQSMKGSPIEAIFSKSEYELIDIKKEFKKFPGFPGYVLMLETGLHFSYKFDLKSGGKRIGILLFHFKDEYHLPESRKSFVWNAVNQVSTAVSNILANEEIDRLNNRLKQEKDYLQEEIKVSYNFEEIVGTSQPLQQVFKKVSQVTKTDTTVLITGESGTGKELIARAVHNASDRKKRALIKLNCATLPPQLLESELFGHEKGAFTGADKLRIGKFEMADKGTIFLDEIGEMPIELQAKLLRVLQEKELERLGGNRVIKTDVRIIAATNRDLESEVAEGNFRSDLYFRLNVFPVHLPPLRERKEDITPLAVHFLKKASRKLGKKISGISSASLKELMEYDWPGNIRELEHIIERAIIINEGTTLNLVMDNMKVTSTKWQSDKGPFQFITLKDAERELILNTLKFCNGRVRGAGGAAEILDIHPATLDSRMKKLGIGKEHVVKKGS